MGPDLALHGHVAVRHLGLRFRTLQLLMLVPDCALVSAGTGLAGQAADRLEADVALGRCGAFVTGKRVPLLVKPSAVPPCTLLSR